jgi:hypothetical protein
MLTPLRSVVLIAAFAVPAHAQFTIGWYIIAAGGGPATSATFTVTGTIGQPDAGDLAGGPFQIAGGFWTQGAVCYPNCDGSSTAPILNVLDFSCFLNKFAAGDPYANCDNSTTAPTLNVLDFACFLNRFAAGCS